MKFFLFDTDGEGMGMDLAMRAQEAGHQTRYFCPGIYGEPSPYGKGLLEKPTSWEPSMDWADLIVLTGNSTFSPSMVEYFGKGYPIFGTNPKAAELELDRGVGQEVLRENGVKTLPYSVVDTPEDAIRFLLDKGKPYVMKPWGGDADKSMSAVPRTVDEAIFLISRWKKEGKFKGQLMLQEKVDGTEMGIAGWFGPGGFNRALEESFEHKKFLNDDLGENTGEMGTVIRHVTKSKLFDLVLEPVTDYLHKVNYVGDVSVNCIIDDRGNPWPLEFTMRLGWPDFCIRQQVISGDPVEWMADLLGGVDSFRVSTEVAVGVLLTHGDFPKGGTPGKVWSGYPITGVSGENQKSLHFQQVMWDSSPMAVGKKVKEVEGEQTAGTYVMVVSGAGGSVTKAAEKAYGVVKEINWPGNMMYRTDIGKKLKEQLPLVQRHGFAAGMKY